jgi:hypothetical protein
MPVSVLLVVLLSATDGIAIPPPRSAEPLHPRIDVLIAASVEDFASRAAPRADDAEFVRRVYLDLTGTLPTTSEVRLFLADSSPDKRVKLIDRLLDGPGYIRRMVWFWDTTLMERRGDSKVPRAAWEAYLRQVVSENRPYDALVREMLSADGSDAKTRPAAKFLLDRDLEPNLVTRDLARVFLGRNLQCAQCHDHPQIDDYLQADYYGIQAFVNRSFLFPNAQAATAVIAEKADGDVNFMSVFDKNKKSNTTFPRLPGGQAILDVRAEKGKEYKVAPAKDVRPVPAYSRRQQLAVAMTSPSNPSFARNAVNRLWAMMMGRGIVHPVDMDHGGNPPSHPELLDLLAVEFASHKYDVKWLVRQIALSETYQRSSVVPAGLSNAPEDRYLVAILKPMTPEQLAHAMLQATGQTDAERAALGPKGTEAQLDGKLAPRVPPFRSMFASRAGESPGEFAATLDQTLFLKYNGVIRGMIAPRAGNLADRLGKIPDAKGLADELFISALSRPPTAEEVRDVSEVLAGAADRGAAVAELIWALVASSEFRFNH